VLDADPTDFWTSVERQRPALLEASERLTETVRERLAALV
jgi:hypothetical protein